MANLMLRIRFNNGEWITAGAVCSLAEGVEFYGQYVAEGTRRRHPVTYALIPYVETLESQTRLAKIV